jgi:hypothetical protein
LAKCGKYDNGKDNGRKGKGNGRRHKESTVLQDCLWSSRRKTHDEEVSE